MKRFLLFLLAVVSVAAHAAVIDSLPFTITEPGTYVLTHNMTFPSDQPLIFMQGPITGPVTIDFQGFTITGGPLGLNATCIWLQNWPIQPNQPAVVIRNGTITGFSEGIVSIYVNVKISKMVFKQNNIGITLSDAVPSTVANCVFNGLTDSGGYADWGILDDGSGLESGGNIYTNNIFANVTLAFTMERSPDPSTPMLISRFDTSAPKQ